MIKSISVPVPQTEILVSRRAIQPGACCEATLPQWVMGPVLEGTMEEGQPNGKRVLIRKGDFAITRGHTPQRWQVVGKTIYRAMDCIFDPRPHWIPWLNWPEFAPGFMVVPLRDTQVFRKVCACMMRAYRLGRSGTPEAMDYVYHEIEKVLLLVNRYCRHHGAPAYDPRVDKAVRYLSDNLAVHAGLNEVAAYCGLSRARMASLFKRQVGVGPIAFQNEQRIDRARQMLRMSFMSVKEIALDLGFKNPKYFSTCFRRINGASPGRYRKQKNRLAPPPGDKV